MPKQIEAIHASRTSGHVASRWRIGHSGSLRSKFANTCEGSWRRARPRAFALSGDHVNALVGAFDAPAVTDWLAGADVVDIGPFAKALPSDSARSSSRTT